MSDEQDQNPGAETESPQMTSAEAQAHVDRAMTMIRRMDLDGALAELAAVDEAIRFAVDPVARVQWGRVLNGLGFIDLMDAKEARAAVDELDEMAETAFRRGLKFALARFEQALAVQAEPKFRRYAECNKAYALALLGRGDAARELFRTLLGAGGRNAYDEQIKDTRHHPIPEDRAVVRMLDEIWEEQNK
ncbi:MAG: hypothetical protein RIA64_07635 [Rhodospirillales bacterium]